MLSIETMVRFGPWMLRKVTDLGRKSAKCERCPQQIRYVYLCESLEGEFEGKRYWAIGSTCGPTLIRASAEEWNKVVKSSEDALKLMARLSRIVDEEKKEPEKRLYRDRGPWAEEALSILSQGKKLPWNLRREVLLVRLRRSEIAYGLRKP